jgi:ribosomal protein L7/L12
MSAYNELQLSSFVDQIFERLRAIEKQLAILSEKAGVPYEAVSREMPEEVVQLVESGDRIGALRKYRELTGAEMDAAQEAISKI